MALVKCPDCGKEISDVAAACPNCGRSMVSAAPIVNVVQPKKKKNGCLVAIAVLFGVSVVGGVIGNMNDAGKAVSRASDSAAAARGDTAAMKRLASAQKAERARVLDDLRDGLEDACKREILETLKAPATAKFPSDKWQPRFDPAHDTATAILGSVDSENSFGAMIRTDFGCVGHVSPSTMKYGLDSIIIGDKVIRYK